MSAVEIIQLTEIIATPDTQMRVVGIDPGTVASYAEDLRSGATFPPIEVFRDPDGRCHLADGFYRVEAARLAGLTSFPATVKPGTSRDAILAACAANATHGLRRTNEDKRRTILAMLRDPEWAKWSDRAIAKACTVDHKTVAKLRGELTAPKGGEEIPTRPRGDGMRDTGGEIPTASAMTMAEKMLATVSDAALIAECQRRGRAVP